MDRGGNTRVAGYRSGQWCARLPTTKAEALHLAHRTCEALEAIEEAEGLVERSEERWCCAELHRLRAVFLAAIGADEP